MIDSTDHALKVEQNIMSMKLKLSENTTLTVVSCSTDLQSLTGTHAKPEVQKDLLGFWDIGIERYKNRIRYYILKDPSAKVPQRKLKLQTFAASKRAKRTVKLLEKERKLVSKCMRRTLAWNAKADKDHLQLGLGGQYIELPRAISDRNGIPHKGQKSYTTKWITKRYIEANVITSELPDGWIADTVVLEGMFIINTSPLVSFSSMKEYSSFLIRRYVLPYFKAGTPTVHIVFDNPGRLPATPKAFEQNRRDSANKLPSDHKHIHLNDTSSVPSKWREHLSCRTCKRSIVLYLGKSLLDHSSSFLLSGQQIILAGCFVGDMEDQAWSVTSTDRQPLPHLNCQAEEADMSVWLHAFRSQGMRRLIWSPDTDIYHISLPLISQYQGETVVKINLYSSDETQYLNLNHLCDALSNDPDLATIPSAALPKLMQVIYICTGCDYISFFARLGKTTFLNRFFQHSEFINAGTETCPGTLASTTEERSDGLLAFIRLVGTVYFKQHLACFHHDSPRALFNSFSDSDPETQHRRWLDCIRSTIWEKIEFEDELPPSSEALERHWKRSCWVADMWSQACRNEYNLPDLTKFGWKLTDGELQVDWDDTENMKQVRQRVHLLLRGCGCRKTRCTKNTCSCRKAGQHCSPGCTCCNCQNVPSSLPSTRHTVTHDDDLEDELEEDSLVRREYQSQLVPDDDVESICTTEDEGDITATLESNEESDSDNADVNY